MALPLLVVILLATGAAVWTTQAQEDRLQARREAVAQQRNAAETGAAALARTDCLAALPLLRRAADGPEPLVAAGAESRHRECATYLALRRAPATPASRAALHYMDYLTTVTDAGLRRAAARAALATFRRTPESQLVAPGTCSRRGDVQDHIVGRAAMDRRMPLFLIGCAKAAELAGDTGRAAGHYQFAYSNYGRSPHRDQMLAGWVRTAWKMATSQERWNLRLGTPNRFDRRLGNRARIVTANRTDDWVRMGVRGPVTDMVLIPACTGCSPSDPGHEECGGNTPTGSFVVPAGTYDVLLGFPTDGDDPGVGRWTLEPGGVYEGCFVDSED